MPSGRRHTALLVVFVVSVLFLMTYQVRTGAWRQPAFGAFSPILDAINFVVDGVVNTWEDYIHVVGVQTENRRLRRAAEKFDLERSLYQETLSENHRLRGLLEIKDRTACVTLAAEVIAESPQDWVRTLTVNRGTGDGVQNNMPVVGLMGLVGQVISASSSSAKVLLVTDAKSSVAVRLQSSRESAIMDGSGDTRCRLKYVHKDAPVSVGEQVITSGLDGIYPEGIPVGAVDSIDRMEYGIFQDVYLMPAERFRKLEEVLIVLSGPECDGRGWGP